MSKKESNHIPEGTVRPPAPIKTDNTAVILALEKRVEELEEAANARRTKAHHAYAYRLELEAENLRLKAVAGAAAAIAEDFPQFTVLAKALRAAGYLK